MPVIRIPAPLRHYTGKQPEVAVQGETVGAAMEDADVIVVNTCAFIDPVAHCDSHARPIGR